ncbi:uncharacterized protein LOC142776724 [Rhipicephalus microplus]|uniref:uncharacterized protein LOC142776724 n=1 Tax=Rhipicephalus microplus TaxID=6941 RepID=UPI003F6D1BBA
MERRRTRLVRLASTASDSAEEVPREENAPNEAGAQCACSASQQVKELENEVRELRKRLEVAENMLDSYDMVKKLRKILRKTEKDPSPAVEAERASIPNFEKKKTFVFIFVASVARYLVQHN